MTDKKTKQEEKYKYLTQANIEPLIVKMAIPTIISMLTTSFYNMADTFFVSKINTQSTAAVGIVFSMMAIIQAIGFFFGHGSGNYISIKLGAKDTLEASKMAATGFLSAMIVGFIILIFGIIFINPLAHILGSTNTILPYSKMYMKYILIGAPYMTASIVLNNQLRLQGNALFAMIGLISGAIINIILDPIFIFYFEITLPNGSAAQLLDVMDYISNSVMMPFIALLSAILIGWIKTPDYVIGEMERNGETFGRKAIYRVMIRYIAPLMMFVLFLQSTGIFA